MESIGKILKKARESAGFSIDQVARETHISKRYLNALEEEDFSAFPGETYTIGFLRNYAEYLGLNTEEIIGLYKNLKIQEQPVPIDELLDVKKKGLPLGKIITGVLIVVVLAVGGYLGYSYFKASGTKRQVEATGNVKKTTAGEKAGYLFQEEAITRWFVKGDTIQYQLGDNTYSIKIVEIDSEVKLATEGKNFDIPLGGKTLIDFNGDNQPDLRVTLNDIDKSKKVVRVNLGLYKITKPVSAVAKTGVPKKTVSSEGGNQQVVASQTAGRNYTIVEETDTPAPFLMKFNFRGYCFFRYLVDDKDRVERFFHKGESFVLDVKNYATLWISNAGVVKANIAGKDVTFGRPGQVVTRSIRWVKKDNGSYELRIVTLY